MNRNINTWRIKPISDGIELEQAKKTRNHKAQREIKLLGREFG